MKRRNFMQAGSLVIGANALPTQLLGQSLTPMMRATQQPIFILVELKGANDGLNTIIPYADKNYYALRPRLAIAREQILQLNEQWGLHPALQPLLEIWQKNELAIVQGLGYAQGNLSHFRSIEIWDTASNVNEYLQQGWLTRAFESKEQRLPKSARALDLADIALIGSPDLGPALGSTRAIVLNNTMQFINQARLAQSTMQNNLPGDSALAHILNAENEIVQAANGLRNVDYVFKTSFQNGGFADVIKTAAQVLAKEKNGYTLPVLRLTLGGFDTHQNQLGTHANLLKQLAEGLSTLRAALMELNLWHQTVVMTYSEFGRRARENNSAGTDHGTAAPHFVMGGKVKGALYGVAPNLERLDGNGNSLYTLDFRALYATVLQHHLGLSEHTTQAVLGQRFAPIPLM